MNLPDLKQLAIEHALLTVSLQVDPEQTHPFISPPEKIGRRQPPAYFKRYTASNQRNILIVNLVPQDQSLQFFIVMSKSSYFQEFPRGESSTPSVEDLLAAVGESTHFETFTAEGRMVFDLPATNMNTVLPLPLRFPNTSAYSYNAITGLRLSTLGERGQITRSAIIDIVGRRLNISLRFPMSLIVDQSAPEVFVDVGRSALSELVLSS